MKKYRIIEHVGYGGKKSYEVQKRFLGFLWWYNFNNIDAYIDGIYDTKEEAEKAIEHERFECSSRICEEYD